MELDIVLQTLSSVLHYCSDLIDVLSLLRVRQDFYKANCGILAWHPGAIVVKRQFPAMTCFLFGVRKLSIFQTNEKSDDEKLGCSDCRSWLLDQLVRAIGPICIAHTTWPCCDCLENLRSDIKLIQSQTGACRKRCACAFLSTGNIVDAIMEIGDEGSVMELSSGTHQCPLCGSTSIGSMHTLSNRHGDNLLRPWACWHCGGSW